jgi:hypothetical protein
MLSEVRVFNSENRTHYYFVVRKDRLQEFFSFAADGAQDFRLSDGVPGLSGPASLGLSAIFPSIPSRFPVNDIAAWLLEQEELEQVLHSGNIEDALARFAETVPQLLSDGSDL